jgi:hypothetical protein
MDEIIILNVGSRDDTQKILENFHGLDKLRIIHLSENRVKKVMQWLKVLPTLLMSYLLK